MVIIKSIRIGRTQPPDVERATVVVVAEVDQVHTVVTHEEATVEEALAMCLDDVDDGTLMWDRETTWNEHRNPV